MNRDNLVSVCSLVQGSLDGLAQYLRSLSHLLDGHYENYEIVLIGNGMSTEQRRVAQQEMADIAKTRLVVLTNVYDEDVGYSAALDTAIGDVVVLMDYRTDSVEPILPMIEKVLGGIDIVLANNTTATPEPLWYRILAKNYYRLVEVLVMSSLDFDRTYFSCYSRTTVNLMTGHKSKIRNLRLLRNTLGVATETINYQQSRPARLHRRQYLANHIFARAEEALSFSVRPLRAITFLCLSATLLNAIYAGYVLFARLFFRGIAPGWASTELVQSAMLGVLFFALGIIAITLNIILQEVMQSPSYAILNDISSGMAKEENIRKNVVE
jgi:hypothetical protein